MPHELIRHLQTGIKWLTGDNKSMVKELKLSIERDLQFI